MALKSLTRNSIYYLIYNILSVLFPFITGIYIARVLLQSDIGQIESAKNLAQYFVVFSFLGIPTYGLREIAKTRNKKEELDKVYSELMIINSFSTTVFSLIYFSLILIVPYYRDNIVLYSIAGISILLNFLNNTWLYEGLEKFGYTSIRNTVFKIISFALLLIFVRSKDDYVWYLIITVIGTAGNYFLNVIHSRGIVAFTIKGINLKRHFKPILYLVAVNLAIEIYSLVDVTMLGFIADDISVAVYSYGMKIFKIFLQIVNTFTMVLVPRISLYYNEGKTEEFNRLVSKTLKTILIIAVPAIVGIFFVSDYLITAIYGEQYLRSAKVLKILSLILSISPVGYLLGSRMLLVTNNEKKMIIAVASGALTNLVANFFLINLYSEIGAAIASVLGEIVVMIIYIALGHKYFVLIDLKDSLFKEFIALLLMTGYLIGTLFLQISQFLVIILQISGSILLYFGTLIICKEQVINDFLINVRKIILKKEKRK